VFLFEWFLDHFSFLLHRLSFLFGQYKLWFIMARWKVGICAFFGEFEVAENVSEIM